MRRHGIAYDTRGKEAFAYLAVILLILTSASFIYIQHLNRSVDSDLKSVQDVLSLSTRADDICLDIRSLILSEHDVLVDSASSYLKPGDRLDAAVESALYERLNSTIREGSSALGPKGSEWELVHLHVECVPMLAGVPGPVPQVSEESPNGTGSTSMADRCEVMGVASNIKAVLRFSSTEYSASLEREILVETSRRSLANMAVARTDRLRSEIEGGEMDRLVSYMITTYAQQKAMLGYGRPPEDMGADHRGPLLREEEIGLIMDLAAGMISGTQLLGYDEAFMDGISSEIDVLELSDGRGASLNETLSGGDGAFDPSTVLMLTTGFMSEGNLPSADELLRPIIEGLMERLVERLLSYTGLEDMYIDGLGSYFQVMDLANEAVSSGLETLLGLRLVEEGSLTAYEIFLRMLEEGGYDVTEGFSLMRRSHPAINGGKVEGYPLIDMPDIEGTFEVYVSQNDPDHIYYLDGEGNLHLGSEYRTPEDVYAGHLCKIYEVDASFSRAPAECPLEEVFPWDDDAFRFELMQVLSGEMDPSVVSALNEVKAMGRQALMAAMNRTLQFLSSEVQVWEGMIKGWNVSNPPSISDDRPPILQLMSMNMEAMEGFMDLLGVELVSLLKEIGYEHGLGSLQYEQGRALAGWLNESYLRWVGSNEQMSRAFHTSIQDFRDLCMVDVLDIREAGSGIEKDRNILFPYDGIDDIDGIASNWAGLAYWGLKGWDEDWLPDRVGADLSVRIRDAVEECRRREVYPGGAVSNALISSGTRGGLHIDLTKVPSRLLDCTLDSLLSMFDDVSAPYHLTGMRSMLPSVDLFNGTIQPSVWEGEGSAMPPFAPRTKLKVFGPTSIVIGGRTGIQDTDVNSNGTPYRTFYEISLDRSYGITYDLNGDLYPNNASARTIATVSLEMLLEIDTAWPMHGCDYEPTRTLRDDMMDQSEAASRDILSLIMDSSSELMGGSLSSLSELPPLVMDIMSGKELDLGEIARVLTNVTLDITSTVREGVKTLVKEFVEGGLSAAIFALLDLLGIDVLHLTIPVGPAILKLSSETKALKGGNGSILIAKADIPGIGLSAVMGLKRAGNASVVFNATVEIDNGPLYLRIELDPFMEHRSSIFTLEGIYRAVGEDIRISLKAPELVQYRSAEVSLKSTLGIEPSVFIPPIGVSVFFNAGFRINYLQPDELGPKINEIGFTGDNISDLELYNPQRVAVGGYTLEVGTETGIAFSHRLTSSSEALIHFRLGPDTLNSHLLSLDAESDYVIRLRDASGEVLDAVELTGVRRGWYSRDADGYGVFRWGNGTPGETNSEMVFTSFSMLLLSIVMASIKEAWSEAYALYGISFDTLVYFIQRALDLFVERICGAIAELVLDVRMFLSMKIALGAGVSAGIGLELSFLAEGEAVARFLMWVYENIKVLIGNIFHPEGAGDYVAFPMGILTMCHVELRIYTEVDTPPALSKMASPGVEIPSTLTLAVAGRFNIALPMKLLGHDIGSWKVSLGIYVMEAPSAIVSMLYDVTSLDCKYDLWLLRASVWSEPK